MKKAAIIVCAAIYALAIIIVAFLGYQAEVRNPPIYADDVVLVYDKLPYDHIENGLIVYEIREVPALASGDSTDEDEHAKKVYKYEVEIFDFEYVYEVLNAQIQVQAKPISFKVDEETGEVKQPDEKNLSYTVNSKDVKVNKEGIVTFNEYDDHCSYDLLIKTIDTSNITIYVRIYW